MLDGVEIPHEKGRFCEKGSSFVKHTELCRNGGTDRFAVWVANSGGPKEAVQLYSTAGANVHNFDRIRQMAPIYSTTLCRELCKNG